MLPGPWLAIVLLLAVYRVVRLTGWDDFPPVARLRARLVGERCFQNSTINRDELTCTYSRPTLNHFVGCPFCQGFWWSVVAYAIWVAVGAPGAVGVESWAFYVAGPFALSGAVGLLAKNLDP